MSCADRSYPHSPILLRATPTASPVAEDKLLVPPIPPRPAEKYQPSAPARHAICQARLQMPARTTPMRRASRGAAHVALISKTLLPTRATPTAQAL